MAYGQNTQVQGQRSNGGFQAKGTPARDDASSKSYEKDPNEVGIAYAKTSDKGTNYFSVSITQDIPAGSKIMIFENKTKNRSEKTPTHVLKFSTVKK